MSNTKFVPGERLMGVKLWGVYAGYSVSVYKYFGSEDGVHYFRSIRDAGSTISRKDWELFTASFRPTVLNREAIDEFILSRNKEVA